MALADMEELIGTIERSSMRSYMREAMNCYTAGAYRGCIVLSYIALFDDLLDKLGELGKVNSAAKTIFVEASKKKSDQEVFESYVIDQLTATNLVSGLDNAFLTTLRTLRNKSAHPSGHEPSAEEARFIFREVVTRFLSRAILSTTQLVDEIISRLGNANVFPSPLNQDIKGVVESEINSLHEAAFPQLVVKLVAGLSATNATTKKNARYFLVGLAAVDVPAALQALQAKLLVAKSDDQAYAPAILSVLSANGASVIGLPPVTRARLKKIIVSQVDAIGASITDAHLSNPATAMASMVRALDDAQLIADFKDALETVFDRKPYSAVVAKSLKGRPVSAALYYNSLLKKAGSSTFDIANTFAAGIDNIDAPLSELLSGEQAFQLIVSVLQAAEWGAFTSQALKGKKFSTMPAIRDKAIAYIKMYKANAKAVLKSELKLELKASEFIKQYLTE